MRLQLLVPVFILLSIESSLICIHRGICFDPVRRILVVNLLECVLVEIDWTLAMRCVLID